MTLCLTKSVGFNGSSSSACGAFSTILSLVALEMFSGSMIICSAGSIGFTGSSSNFCSTTPSPRALETYSG